MRQHFCYYCNKEIVKGFSFVTFYTKECAACQVTYHLDWSDIVTLITLHRHIRGKLYSIIHNISENKVRISMSRGCKIKEIVRLDGNYNTITPSNLHDKLRTILTFL